jgi:hypothetical protein
VTEAPPPETFLSGRVGYVGPRRSVPLRWVDRLLDLELRARRVPARLDRLAAATPRRRVLVMCVYRAGSARVGALPAALGSDRHEVTLAFGALGEPSAAIGEATVVSGLEGGKFENLNEILRTGGHDAGDFDWTLVADDDIVLPGRLTDRLVAIGESLGLALLQPAQTLASHAAWPVTRRRPLSVARRTGFVEIGPLFAMSSAVAAELTPFPELRFGWGLELHWAALARERGWRLGVVDALPVRHDEAGVASSYRHADAVSEAQRFLAGHPYVPSGEADRTLAVYRRVAG